MTEHRLVIRAVRPTMTEFSKVFSMDRVVRNRTLGWYLGCAGCEAADPTTHPTREKARQTTWRHP